VDLDALADAFIKIAEEAKEDPELLKGAPRYTPIARPDETAPPEIRFWQVMREQRNVIQLIPLKAKQQR